MGLWDDGADAGIGADASGEEADEAVRIEEAQLVD
jgi:hypothetical protein